MGDFYTCATDNVSKNHYRIVISVSKHDSDNVVEIFSQMCKKNMIHKNIAKFYEIYLEIMEIFGKLDKKLLKNSFLMVEENLDLSDHLMLCLEIEIFTTWNTLKTGVILKGC